MKTYTIEELISALQTISMKMHTREEQAASPDIWEPTRRFQEAVLVGLAALEGTAHE